MDILNILLITILVLQLLVVCYSDIRHRIITNRLIITIAITTLFLSFTQHNTVSVFIPLLSLITGYTLFHFKLIGGGDVKLITVLQFALTSEQSLNFILYSAIMGGVVMMIGMLINRADIQCRGVPYAVAISIGFLLSLYL